ncbi:DUF4430 domain-containing protein [Parasporobacterium paucivorans]|uniref:Transcobalamin-like C-terminal domain-containing protein n=1 Tax=Parasporobacterium paucivorans DSM 15970 TaxID=1122934 RepID=A0A1M6DJB6_9FIRM|nr:DUF4430 domain-containing protein [Parasporobacterium paucivorans]SHI73282.1 protein of unknown function [Parasporobacterium paucivorans DSM 15970]
MKKLFLAVVLFLVLCMTACGLESVDQYESKIEDEAQKIRDMQEAPGTDGNISITLTVRCDRVMKHPSLNTDAVIPDDGFWINEKKIVVKEASSVYDVMIAARYLELLDFKDGSNGGHTTGYISNINNLIEKECGPESGWKFAINGELAPMGCKQVKVKDGDEIVWFYAITANDTLN